MFETLSPLAGSLIAIVLVWITALIIGQIVKVSILKSLESEEEKEKNVERISNIKKGFKVYNIAVSAISAVAFLIFALFLNNLGAKDESRLDKIQQAPLPEDFQTPTKAEIDKSNEKSVSEKSEEVREKATKDNTKAMNDAIDIFKKAK